MYSFEQLRIFITVCETGSFSAAARKLNRAQSGISQAIANLEISINQTLFDRSGNIPELTSEGEALLPVVKALMLQQLHLEQKIASLEQQHEHELVIAIEESLISPALLGQLALLADEFPITNIEIIAESTLDIGKLIEEGSAHIGIVYADGKIHHQVDFTTVGYTRFITVAAPEHPLSNMHGIKDIDLRHHRQVVLRATQGQELWFSNGISSQHWYASNHNIINELTQQGIGWSILPEEMVQSAIEQGRLIKLDIDYEPNGWINTVDCLSSRRHPLGPVYERAMVLIKDYMNQQNLHNNFQINH
ncbi:LysR family transcriptional regulator [Shewanella sp. UCD-FRSSP16_17]|uniref:LysR family transcriptional regulator n=1 Tax=Shewanella TaxID=22 RepID=UPI0007EEE374|nr:MULTISPECIES: LysR family transcriptional regulator [Shewanella]OBT07149.1 LysR family transcriptional regulator [Shewanella sp. UCD-FRSSP16_17]